MHPSHNRLGLLLSLALLLASASAAQSARPVPQDAQSQPANLISIDATEPIPAPQPVLAALGTSRTPSGQVLAVNSQYLTLDGKPWLPVMGEFHFSRLPESQWETEILKMKSSGVQIISTYIIWSHHEEIHGVFDWSGQRDLRRFVELCQRHHMYVFARIGPWAHGEVRQGGLPDWVVQNSPTRRNDPVYLAEVDRFYAQIALQLKGLLWKDGGPVLGIQLENEYRSRGPGQGDEHIDRLKQLALAHGLDVPLYTVTGWDGAAVPADQVLPVFGGYTDAPWGSSPDKMPPNEVFAFHFENRAAGSMGALGGQGQNPSSVYRGTPYLTAELAGGAEDTYFRRPVIHPDDIAALAPVLLGSGANLIGYYMYQGGRNPAGKLTTLQESQRTGYPTDVPVLSYDFQAPLGEFGQQRESLSRIKLVNYFLADFGPSLAPMATRRPAAIPTGPADLSLPRFAARTQGRKGFLFFNNHVRDAAMPARPGLQVRLALPGGTLAVPASPIDLPADSYGIWPVNFDMQGVPLVYSTAQLFKRITVAGQTYFFFFTIPGIEPEFAFAPHTVSLHTATGLAFAPASSTQSPAEAVELLRRTTSAFPLRTAELVSGQSHVHLVLLDRQQAEQIWVVPVAHSGEALLATPNPLYADTEHVVLDSATNSGDSADAPIFDFSLFGASPTPQPGLKPAPGTPAATSLAPLFIPYQQQVPAIEGLSLKATQTRQASTRGPWQWSPRPLWDGHRTTLAPEDSDFAAAAAVWRLELTLPAPTPQLENLYLTIRYQGDVARLLQGTRLLDDNFYNGTRWRLALNQLDLQPPPASTSRSSASDPSSRASSTPARTSASVEPSHTRHLDLNLEILPLPKDPPMFLEDKSKLTFPASGQLDALDAITLTPEYKATLHLQPPPPK